MTQPTPDWVNVLNSGAVNDGVTDSTVAIQAALTALEATGGTLYFPAGQYLISAGLSYTSAKPLYILGDQSAGQVSLGKTGTCIHSTVNVTVAAVCVENASLFLIKDIDICQDATLTFNAGNGFQGIYCGSVNEARVERVQIGAGTGNYSFNTAIEFYNGTFSIAKDCAITGEVNGVWFTAGSQAGAGCSLYDMQITTTPGNGFGAIRMDGAAATLNVTNCYTYRGDWGFTTGTASGNNPTFVTISNLQINNPRAGGMFFGTGSQIWLNQVWISFAGTPNSYNTTEGIHFGSSFEGAFYGNQLTVQGPAHNGIYIGGGSGFNFSNCSIGGCGWAANNTYYDLYLHGSNPRITTITGCHFDVDVYNGISGSGNKPAAAIGIDSGVFHTTITGCISLSGGSYASGNALQDSSGSTATAGNWNI